MADGKEVELFVVQYRWPGEAWRAHWYPPCDKHIATCERDLLRSRLSYEGKPPETRIVRIKGEVVDG